LIVGVTGGIGTGKTTFVTELARYGAAVFDADAIARTIVEENQEIRNALMHAFGEDIFDSKGNLLRRKLGQIVFSNQSQLDVLNAIIQPILKQLLQNRAARFRKECPGKLAVIDMAILYEAGMESLCDRIIVVTAPNEFRETWLMQDRGWTRKEARQRIDAQMNVEIKRKRADIVVANTGSLAELFAKARSIYKDLVASDL
jgi:dephospho-CoA kinase